MLFSAITSLSNNSRLPHSATGFQPVTWLILNRRQLTAALSPPYPPRVVLLSIIRCELSPQQKRASLSDSFNPQTAASAPPGAGGAPSRLPAPHLPATAPRGLPAACTPTSPHLTSPHFPPPGLTAVTATYTGEAPAAALPSRAAPAPTGRGKLGRLRSHRHHRHTQPHSHPLLPLRSRPRQQPIRGRAGTLLTNSRPA